LNYPPTPLDKIVRALAIVGIIIHETSHIMMCFLTNTRIDRIKFLEKSKKKDEKNPTGFSERVDVGKNTNLSFLQAILIGLAFIFKIKNISLNQQRFFSKYATYIFLY